jgi:hypothetical protein
MLCRLQLAGGKERYGNLSNCFKTVLKEEGPTALFKGELHPTDTW